MLRSFTVVAAVAAVLSLAHSAGADPWTSRSRPAEITVSYSDLNLSNPHDAQIMLVRLTKAANRACGSNPRFLSSYDLTPDWANRQFRKCVDDALGGAVAQLSATAVAFAFAEANSAPNMRVAEH